MHNYPLLSQHILKTHCLLRQFIIAAHPLDVPHQSTNLLPYYPCPNNRIYLLLLCSLLHVDAPSEDALALFKSLIFSTLPSVLCRSCTHYASMIDWIDWLLDVAEIWVCEWTAGMDLSSPTHVSSLLFSLSIFCVLNTSHIESFWISTSRGCVFASFFGKYVHWSHWRSCSTRALNIQWHGTSQGSVPIGVHLKFGTIGAYFNPHRKATRDGSINSRTPGWNRVFSLDRQSLSRFGLGFLD